MSCLLLGFSPSLLSVQPGCLTELVVFPSNMSFLSRCWVFLGMRRHGHTHAHPHTHTATQVSAHCVRNETEARISQKNFVTKFVAPLYEKMGSTIPELGPLCQRLLNQMTSKGLCFHLGCCLWQTPPSIWRPCTLNPLVVALCSVSHSVSCSQAMSNVGKSWGIDNMSKALA